MPEQLFDNWLLTAGGAFLLGFLVAKLGGWLGNKFDDRERDPRDDRIRSLSADVRVAQSSAEKARVQLEEASKDLTETQKLLTVRDDKIAGQEKKIQSLKSDLKESVLKTRELRAELSDRAIENTKSEARLREIETELSVARASTDLLASGMLDYTGNADDDDTPTFTPGGRR
jgi:chromosome segregation ATPase